MPVRRLALKVDVDTYRGTREGVPRLLDLLARYEARATFLFSLGPDHTGRAIRRVLRPGFIGKVRRTSVVQHYGWRTLLSGTLLPGPHIADRCADLLRAARAAGHETGIHAYDHVRWQNNVAAWDEPQTQQEMDRACDRFRSVFGEPARVHGAAGWQMNAHAFRLTEHLGFAYASDTRGDRPFLPVVDDRVVQCPQLPTTLPTLDEMIGAGGATEENCAHRLLDITANPGPVGHVFTLHAELEGMRWAPVFDKLMQGWLDQGYMLVSLREYATTLGSAPLPRHQVISGVIPGRSGTLALQGPAVSADNLTA